MAKLTDKVAVITGGGSGIGLASAKLFAQEGATVVIVGRNKDALDKAAAEIGGSAAAIVADVADLDALDALYAEVGKRFGRIDVIFANAGVNNLAPFEAVTVEDFDTQFNANVRGLFFTVQKALPLLSDGASVILNASVAHGKGTPMHSVYAATKAAVRSFARSWTTDLKHRKIRVNSLSPGLVETPIFGKLGVPAEAIKEGLPAMLAQMPMGRVGRPEEAATVALFLASADSSFVTGIDLPVDGGMGQV
ncbi:MULTISPECIES: SDR family oxidoreductase [Rhizobium]|jgi:NAD(P)-dependent dehydrogenase (short-subunit alcohol dehydrogenase family)|uniref:Short-chain dehydrogenase/reductase SDR n=1 Tax=Rhizobium leguminosarum bv. trifolii (strain WSM1325) TaxID=395491 RepID=C6AWB0_RHILS|nr:SDR family oxidoreductase [Rhizobium leguminosarum]ACS55948.1 short-chain dehydrogenase/reductase SDR [Rhizobium leguminosarum bv. trifolii WSM1325]MBY2908165.1 SDR family oxidoreductase [Rhizobium leguminosarum]MBY2916071.1 SDR family oxidoreductase [Rhizobium leguminosarum]MBY2921729.1 SDR family oxidoreductase [Rhizobium leguminosarum]MBY2935453.1 SDR family oxidoreductase [Rhizobium leguminosarum]